MAPTHTVELGDALVLLQQLLDTGRQPVEGAEVAQVGGAGGRLLGGPQRVAPCLLPQLLLPRAVRRRRLQHTAPCLQTERWQLKQRFAFLQSSGELEEEGVHSGRRFLFQSENKVTGQTRKSTKKSCLGILQQCMIEPLLQGSGRVHRWVWLVRV